MKATLRTKDGTKITSTIECADVGVSLKIDKGSPIVGLLFRNTDDHNNDVAVDMEQQELVQVMRLLNGHLGGFFDKVNEDLKLPDVQADERMESYIINDEE